MARASQQNFLSSGSAAGAQISPAQSRYKLGQALAQKGRWEEAIAYYRKALELDPSLTQAQQALDQALAQSKTASQSGPNATSHKSNGNLIPEQTAEGQQYRKRSQQYAQQGKWQEAAHELQQLVQVEPSFEGYRDLGRVQNRLQQPAEATQSWYQAVSLAPDRATAEEHGKLGDSLAQQQQWEAAATCYRRALEGNPNWFQVRFNLAKVLAGQEQWEDAIAAYREAIQLNSESAEAYQGLAIALEYQEKWEEAMEAYRQAMALQPETAWVGERLATLLEQQQDWEMLEAVCRQGIEHHPNAARFHHLLGDALSKFERWEEAVEAYRQAIALDSEFSWSHNNLGDALLQLERWEEAAEAYRSAIALKDDFVWSYYHLGKAALNLEHWQEAIEALQQALTLQDDLPGVEELLADALRLRAKADLEKSVEHYRRAIAENPDYEKLYHKALDAKPDDADLYVQLGNVLSRHGKQDGAIAFYQIALQLDPENSEANHQLGQVYEKKI